MLIRLVATMFLTACSQSEGASSPPPLEVGNDGAVALESLRAAVRSEAARLYGRDCEKLEIPNRAFVPIEISGGGPTEYAVLFGRALCTADGFASANLWLGTGGANVQIWSAFGGPPRMLLEHSMHGFTPLKDGLVSAQHGGFCPGGAGPNACIVEYRWNGRDQALEVAKRTYFDSPEDGEPPRFEWWYEQISR